MIYYGTIVNIWPSRKVVYNNFIIIVTFVQKNVYLTTWFWFYDGYDHSNISSQLKASYYMTLKYFSLEKICYRYSWRGLLYSLFANKKSVVLTSGSKKSVDNIIMNEFNLGRLNSSSLRENEQNEINVTLIHVESLHSFQTARSAVTLCLFIDLWYYR